MPRIVPIQLLKCLKVLLDDNGGILSAGEVKRIASLMTKYSKKLVSKCIYVQILKCTKTELLGEFMGAGGWSLVYTWLHDAIRAMNWPLVQEILELLLLCPVDVHRLKINSAPKLVKGLCKDGGNEGVRILAKRLVEQWLKIVTENSENIVNTGTLTTITSQVIGSSIAVTTVTTATTTMTPVPTCLVKASEVIQMAQQQQVNVTTITTPASLSLSIANANASAQQLSKGRHGDRGAQEQIEVENTNITKKEKHNINQEVNNDGVADELVNENVEVNHNAVEENTIISPTKTTTMAEKDPLGETSGSAASATYRLTSAQKKANDSGLVYKIVVKHGQQMLAKVAKLAPSKQQQQKLSNYETSLSAAISQEEDDCNSENEGVVQQRKRHELHQKHSNNSNKAKMLSENVEEEETLDSGAADNSSNGSGSSEEDSESKKSFKKSGDHYKKPMESRKEKKEEFEETATLIQKSITNDKNKSKTSKVSKERRSSSGCSTDRERDRDKSIKRSSSSHKSSSSHSNDKSSSSRTSSSKTKSSSHGNSSDKYRSKEHLSSKDKERSSSSTSSTCSSSKHKSSSSSSSSKERHREKERVKSSSSQSSSHKNSKENDKAPTTNTNHLKDNSNKIINEKTTATSPTHLSTAVIAPSMEKLGRIPKKTQNKEDALSGESNEATSSTASIKPLSINIPSKKSSMSIEIRKDTERAKTVKTYKSQFRSHGLTEEAPPPPSRKGLKKPSTGQHVGSVLPTSLPSSTLKRPSSPSSRGACNNPALGGSTSEKKAKIDLNNMMPYGSATNNDKPGAIKLIPPKKIQTLVETNIFSDALSAATGPKKLIKRKKSSTVTPPSAVSKELGPSPPTSPDLTKVVRLKFYQDTLDESPKGDENKTDNGEGDILTKNNLDDSLTSVSDKGCDIDDDDEDDDIPLKKVKEDIDQKVAKERNHEIPRCDGNGDVINTDDAVKITNDDEADVQITVKKPGPGCGPDGPPGVLMAHRRKGPKKKLTWCPQETLEQIRYFELDETERVNVTKTSFMDMKNLERFNERDAIKMSRRGFHREDNMVTQMAWKPLIEVDEVPAHPDGSQSQQRKIQAERETITLRALYFSHAIIPDSPAEPEIEPAFAHDIPVIPLDDITGNPDAVNDFTSMPWPESKGSPKQGDNVMAGIGGLGSPVDMFSSSNIPMGTNNAPTNLFNPFVTPFANAPNVVPPQQQLPMGPAKPTNSWQASNSNNIAPNNNNMGAVPMPFGPPSNIDMGVAQNIMVGAMGNNAGPAQNFMNHQYGPFGGPGPGPNQFIPNNTMFNGPGNNFGHMGPGGLMMGAPLGNIPNNGPPPHMMGPSQRSGNNCNNGSSGGNWRSGRNNYSDNGGGGNNWRSGPNRGGGNNTGVCKAYMRGHCRLGKSCKYIHGKSKRI